MASLLIPNAILNYILNKIDQNGILSFIAWLAIGIGMGLKYNKMYIQKLLKEDWIPETKEDFTILQEAGIDVKETHRKDENVKEKVRDYKKIGYNNIEIEDAEIIEDE